MNAVTHPWYFYNNIFDITALGQGPLTYYNYNFFVTNCNQFTPDSGNNVITNSPAFELGPLGPFYLPASSLLIDAGSDDSVPLAHHTVTTNQAPDLDTIDIGFHYIALDAYGNPLDFDGDGIPDYVEDFLEDYSYAPGIGETDWQTYNSRNRLTGTPGLQVFTPLK